MQTFYIIRYLGDQFSGKTLKEAIEAAMLESPGVFYTWRVRAKDAGAARLAPCPLRCQPNEITAEMLED